MGYSYKCYSDTKDFMKKYVNAEEGAVIYGISKSRIIVIAREAGAVGLSSKVCKFFFTPLSAA